MTKANNSLLMKEMNRKKILSLIRKKAQSRADIARSTGLSRAAVSIIADDLIKDGLIVEGETVKSETGRRPTMLSICPDAYISIGIDLSRTGCNISYIDFASKVVFKSYVALCESADLTILKVCQSVRAELSERFPSKKVLGIGVCCPGPIDAEMGVILNPPGLEMFHNFGIVDSITSHLGLSVFLEKDTNALAISEKNAGKFEGDIVYLLADHGIGCGVVKDGKLFGAKGGMGCEIGHVTLKFDGERCRCGNVGCAELYASIPAILKIAADTFGESIDWGTLVEMAEKDIRVANDLMQRYADMLSTVCVGAVNLFEPDYIVLGGELKYAEGILAPLIEQRIASSCLSRAKRNVRVIGTAFGDNARAYAAAELVIENYFVGE